jgi:membrane protein
LDAVGGFLVGLVVGLGLASAEKLAAASPDIAAYTYHPTAAASGLARWRAALVGSVRCFGADRIPAAAAAVTFYFLLALFPALAAFASLYGFIATVGDVRRQLLLIAGVLPAGAVSVIGDALTRLASTDSSTLGLAFATSVCVSIWSANAGAKAVIDALNVAYEAKERRGFIILNLVTLGFTVTAILTAIVVAAAVSAAPDVLRRLGFGPLGSVALLRWPVTLLVAMALCSVLYRYGPCRPGVRLQLITPGAAIAAVGWIAMSAAFSWYVANFGHYDSTYGSLGAIVGFLTWVWLSLMVLLFGAEFNAAMERPPPRRP